MDHKVLDFLKELNIPQDEIDAYVLNLLGDYITKKYYSYRIYYGNRFLDLINDPYRYLRTTTDAMYDGLLILSPERRILYVNGALRSWLGLHIDWMADKHVNCIFNYISSDLASILESGNDAHQGESTFYTGNTYAFSFRPWKHNGEQIFIASFRDLMRQSRLLQQSNSSADTTNITDQQAFMNRSSLQGKHPAINALKLAMYYASRTDATVLITGETGTGKEIVSRELHINGTRRNKPFVKVNCTAIPEHLIESELFGYEPGSFTGASNTRKIGLLESANEGTILLDEIEALPLQLQPKLLRAIQEKEIMRIGSTKPISLDIRFVAATNIHLPDLIDQGLFRSDLYYRLNVINLNIPPLRDRKDDIALLANTFIKKFNGLYGKTKSLDSSGLLYLESYSWPGNVRELENLMERLVILSRQDTLTQDVIARFFDIKKSDTNPILPAPDHSDLPFYTQMQEFEKQLISNAIEKCGSTHKAAKYLQMSQTTLWNKAKAFDLL